MKYQPDTHGPSLLQDPAELMCRTLVLAVILGDLCSDCAVPHSVASTLL